MKAMMMLFLALLLGSCNSADQPVVEKVQNHATQAVYGFAGRFDGLLNAYFILKDELVAGKNDLARQQATQLAEEIAGMISESGADEAMMKSAEEKARMIALESDLARQREAFLPLSETLIQLARKMGPGEKPIYVQHCPMAFDFSGGDWLSNSKEIMNPYFGDQMLHCGSVVDTLAKN